MENINLTPESFKLEFHFNEEGLLIIGNKAGLSTLVGELQKAAESDIGYHEHLNFSWKERLGEGSFIIDFDWIKEKSGLNKDKAFDVTVIKLDKIGKELWKSGEKGA